MIDHISIAVRDIKAAEVFYTALLAPLGLAKLREWPNAAIGYGKKYPEFWINRRSRHDACRTRQRRAYLPARGLYGCGRCFSCRRSCRRRNVGWRAWASLRIQ